MKGKGMKSRNRKNELLSALRSSVRPVGALFFIALLAIGLFGKQTTHAASDRAKKVAAIFVGGGTGGGIAAIAGSAKWFPLGFAGGGLAAGLLARHIIKKRKARKASQAPYQSGRTRRRSNQMLDDDTQDLQAYPTASTRRHVRMYK